MTSLFDAEKRRQNVVDVALDFMACGLILSGVSSLSNRTFLSTRS